jgi:hypothetical protein
MDIHSEPVKDSTERINKQMAKADLLQGSVQVLQKQVLLIITKTFCSGWLDGWMSLTTLKDTMNLLASP